MLNRIGKIASYLRGDCIVLRVDKSKDKLTVDAGNLSQEELKTVANTLFKTAHNLNTVKTA